MRSSVRETTKWSKKHSSIKATLIYLHGKESRKCQLFKLSFFFGDRKIEFFRLFFDQVSGLLLHVQPDQRTVDPTALLTVDEIVISGAGRMVKRQFCKVCRQRAQMGVKGKLFMKIIEII